MHRDSDPSGQPRATPAELPATADGTRRAAPHVDSDSNLPDFADEDFDDGPADFTGTPTMAHIGRYALKRSLGVGGLGTVYEAWDPMLSRTVAVKTLQFDIDTPSRVPLDAIFLNQARAAAALNHPNIVVVHDAGVAADGVYIAMERLRGRDLRQVLANGWKPAPGAAAQLARRVADALAYAHAHGVIHAAIKPSNIFLAKSGKPTVLDFGIARAVRQAGVPGLNGIVAAAPHYLAPEQLAGGAVDGRTDVYALGVVLYEMLTGRKAFDGATSDQIANAILHLHPKPADAVRPTVRPALAAIATRAMARNPSDRYQTAAELSLALRQWSEQYGADARPRAAAAGPAKPQKRGAAAARSPARLLMPLAIGVASIGLAYFNWRDAGESPLAAAQSADTEAQAAPASTAPAPMTDMPSSSAAADRQIAPAAVVATVGSVAAPPSPAPDPAPAPQTAATEPTDVAPATPTPTPNANPPPQSTQPPATASARPAARAAGPAPARQRTKREQRVRPAKIPLAAATVAHPRQDTLPAPRGILRLAVTPWGQIDIDGMAAGTTPPLTKLDLPVGPHRITVRNGDNPPFATTLQVDADKPAVVRHRFGP